MKKLNLVFPMAGDGSRFSYDFKPFLKLGDKTFIEHAVEPFYKFEKHIDNVYFIFRQDQEDSNGVSAYLKDNILFKSDKIKTCILPKKTPGPKKTVESLVENENIKNAIICDCDHKINVDKLFDSIIKTNFKEIVIPVKEIDEQQSKNWSKIVIQNDSIISIVEKEQVDFAKYLVYGIIGCVYFPSLEDFLGCQGEYISDYIRRKVFDGENINLAKVGKSYFFGDPDMLKRTLEDRRSECSVFFDFDGVLVKHSNHSTNKLEDNTFIEENVKQIKKLKDAGHKIIITTARSSKTRDGFVKLLKHKGIPYDDIVMSLPSGPRVLVNDRKPSKLFTQQTVAHENTRDGILEIESPFNVNIGRNKEKILENMSENSGAKTFLLQDHTGKKFVRKYLIKRGSDYQKHADTLRKQYDDLNRFNHYKAGMCPKTIGIHENNYEIFYDMEYLEDYRVLSDLSDNMQDWVLKAAMKDMKTYIYSYDRKLSEQEKRERFLNFVNEKINKKLNLFSKSNEQMNALINSDKLYINGEKKTCLRDIFKTGRILKFAPTRLSPVHGDLTLENIMYNIKTDTYKLIDMDGAKTTDTHFLDYAKLGQSLLSRYGEWKNVEPNITYENESFFCDDTWFNCTQNDINKLKDLFTFEEDSIDKCIFYMSTYFIRFTPFRLKKGINHAIFALMMAVIWLNKLDYDLGVENESRRIKHKNLL